MKYLISESQMARLLKRYTNALGMKLGLTEYESAYDLPEIFQKTNNPSDLDLYIKKFGPMYVLETDEWDYMVQNVAGKWAIEDERGFVHSPENVVRNLGLSAIDISFDELFDILSQKEPEEKHKMMSEGKLDNAIYEYIDEMYKPNFTDGEKEQWGPETYKFFQIELDMIGYFVLYRDGKPSYRFFRNKYFKDAKYNTLLILPDIEQELDQLFGDIWKPIFIKWFEYGTGVKVESLNVARL